MAAEFFPMDSLVTENAETGILEFDRAIDSAIYRGFWANLVKSGIQSDPDMVQEFFKVEATGSGMTVTVNAGFAMLNGLMYRETELKTLQLQAGGSADRIDTVVIHADTSSAVRSCYLTVLQGMPANPNESPVRRTLTRSASVYELGIADIYIPAYAAEVNPQLITDTRYDDTRSGTVRVLADLDLDTQLSTTSVNAVQNRVITNETNRIKSNLNVKVSSFNETTGALYLTSVSL